MDEPDRSSADSGAPLAEQVDAVMLAARVLVGMVAQSVAEVEATVTMPQLRILVIVATKGTTNLGTLATALGVHASNASRACDRLVDAGLLERRESTADRRNLALELSPKGRRLVESVMQRRRLAVTNVVARMPSRQRQDLVPALRAFADAAGELDASAVWPTDPPDARV